MKFIFALMVILNIAFSSDRFEKRGDVVVDSRVGVMWQSKPSTQKFTWNGAKNYCNSLNYGGYSDWRVPHIDELTSLTEKSKYNLAVVTDLIEVKANYYWSSTEAMSSTMYESFTPDAWVIDFNFSFERGYVREMNETYKYNVLCVRGE